MTTYAALTDGTTTVTFASPGAATWYKIESGWAPRIAGFRQSQLGGRGPYEDVTEEIPISIGGSNAAHLYANLNTLQSLIYNANAWYLRRPDSAVLFKYSPEGATVSTAASPLQAATWNASLELPAGWPNIPPSSTNMWTTGVTMRFARTGEWLQNSASVTSASATNGAVIAASLGSSAGYPSPMKITATNVISRNRQPSYFVFADSSSAIQKIQAEALSGGNYTAISSGSGAFSGSIIRYVGTAAASELSTAASLNMGASAYSVGVYINAYASGSPFSVKARVGFGGEANDTSPIVISSANIRYYYLGNVALTTGSPTYFQVIVTPTASAASLYMDQLIAVDLSRETTYTLVLSEAGSYSSPIIDHARTSTPFPRVTNSTYKGDYPHDGDAAMYTSGSIVYGIFLGTDVTGAPQTGWAADNGASMSLTVQRTYAYLSPI